MKFRRCRDRDSSETGSFGGCRDRDSSETGSFGACRDRDSFETGSFGGCRDRDSSRLSKRCRDRDFFESLATLCSELSKSRQYSFEVKQYILRMKRSKAVQFCSKAVNIQFLSEAVQIQNEVKWGGTVLNQSSMDSERSKVRQYSFRVKQYRFRSKQIKTD